MATASLELGIDIGDVDLVCQLGSPRSIATFLQRVGRSGHAIGGTPKGRLFPLSRDELVECAALHRQRPARRARPSAFRDRPLDVLAQQIVAEVAAQDWPEAALHDRLGAPGPSASWRGRISTRSSACWPKASPRAGAGAARSFIAMRSIACCAAGAARERPR